MYVFFSFVCFVKKKKTCALQILKKKVGQVALQVAAYWRAVYSGFATKRPLRTNNYFIKTMVFLPGCGSSRTFGSLWRGDVN